MQMQTLMKEISMWYCPFNLPWHSAVDAKVDKLGDADADVNEWHCPFNLPGHSAVDAKVDRVGDVDIGVDERNLHVILSL